MKLTVVCAVCARAASGAAARAKKTADRHEFDPARIRFCALPRFEEQMTTLKSPPAKAMASKDERAGGGRIGVLLVNLGTPDATDYFSMRRYLKEFLSDRRVIEENRIKWWLIL